jgi:hypothetical protein
VLSMIWLTVITSAQTRSEQARRTMAVASLIVLNIIFDSQSLN